MPENRKARGRSKGSSGANSQQDPMARGYARAEQKNQEARKALDPLAPGERPGAVTAGAIVSTLVALAFWASAFIALFTETTVDGRNPDPVQMIVFALIMSATAYGMWKARYWAVLGFQMLLVLFLMAAVLGLITAQTLVQAIATALLVVGLGFLFYKLVKAMARIQMPQSREPPR